MDEPVRLSKRMSELGLASRREADDYIRAGLVKVNGVTAVLGQKVASSDTIELSRQAARSQEAQASIVINKPVGYVSGQAEDGYEPAKVLVTPENRWDEDAEPRRFSRAMLAHLVPAGRLDIDSTGLLILTQNGRLAKAVIGEEAATDKEYLVRVAQIASGEPGARASQIERLRFGLALDGRALRRARVEPVNEAELRFVLTEGRKRQIRRMCDMVGLKVLRLKRVRIGAVKLGALPAGKWRFMTPGEVRSFLQGTSRSDEDRALPEARLRSPRPKKPLQ